MDQSDLALTFIDSCCYVERGLSEPVKNLWEAYKFWSQESDLRQIRRSDLLSRLRMYFQVDVGPPAVIHNILLKQEDQWEWWGPDELRKIYLITDGRRVKIGISIDPVTRMEFLQVGSSDPLTLIASWPGTREDEHALHERFQGKWYRGEWFSLSSEDVRRLLEEFRQASRVGEHELPG